MPIKFTCPHCQRGIVVKDQLAGKSGACPGCKKVVTVPASSEPPAVPSTPRAAAPRPAPASRSKPPQPAPPPKNAAKPAPPAQQDTVPVNSHQIETPPPPPVDVEAEAAALLADEPSPAETTEVKTIDFNCPYCDEPIQMSAELAGKRAPCPECRNIIKVPEPVKNQPKDWRKADQRLPAGAKLPDQPAPEGAWGTATAGTVGRQALVEAGVIPQKRAPRTFGQKVRWPAIGVTSVIVLALFGWGGWSWWKHSKVDRALKEALTYADSPEAAQNRTAAAALHLGAGEYRFRTGVSRGDSEHGCALLARDQFGKAFVALGAAPTSTERETFERDALLLDLALDQVELGGDKPDADKELRLPWGETYKLLQATLGKIASEQGKLAALRAVVARLIERGQGGNQILILVGQLYQNQDQNRAEALAVAGLELLAHEDRPNAENAAEKVLELYKAKPPPPMRAKVIALALAVGKLPPKAGKGADEKTEDHIGQCEGLARQGKWGEARERAKSDAFDPAIRFRARLGIAAAAVDGKSGDTNDVEEALQAAKSLPKEKGTEVSWQLLELTQLALRAGLAEDRLQEMTKPDYALPGRARLALFEHRLAQSKQPVDAAEIDKFDKGLARGLAVRDLTRHNVRLGAPAPDWPDAPLKAFGSLGTALGLQDREKGR